MEPINTVLGTLEGVNGATVSRYRRFGSAESSTDSRNVPQEAHAVSELYESLDYEIIENQLYKQVERTPKYQFILVRQSINRWVVCFLIGVLTALVACFIDIMVHYTTLLKFTVLRKLFRSCTGDGTMYFPLMTWWAFNCGFVAIASALVVFFAGPVAAGSGIPQIKCFLNGVMIPGVVRVKTLIAKAVGVAFSVAGGLSVGKEGPMIHSGAVVAAGISQGRCVSIPFDFKVFEYFRSDREKRDFVSTGAAAGVSAAFGAPIGGVLFSLEEGASFWNQALTWRTFFGSMVSMFTLSLVLSTFYSRAGQLSWSGLANFGTFADTEYQYWEIFFFLVIGVFGGLTGALFNHINLKLTVFRTQFFVKPWQKFVEALLIAAISATVAFLTIYFIEDCQTVAVLLSNSTSPEEAEKVVQLWCPDGQYSAVAYLYFRSPEDSVKSLFHSSPDSFRPLTLGVFAAGYFLLSMWTYGLSVPSGLFIPTLLTGAAWGRLFGIGLQHMFPDENLDPGKYALAGAAAQLGGVVRMTISLCAIIIEATHDITFGLPIMLILMMAKWVGDYFNEGLYDIHIELAEVPILGWQPPKPSANILAQKIMRPKVMVFRTVENVGKLYYTLLNQNHHGFPVVDDLDDNDEESISHGRLNGLILKYQLITLLQHRMFSADYEGAQLVAGARRPKLSDFRDAYPRSNVQLSHISLSEEDKECWMDLRPYMNPHPYRVEINASLPSIYQLFRGLGLRNLIVVDKNNRVRGMITRKDVARFKEIRRKNKFFVKEIYISAAE